MTPFRDTMSLIDCHQRNAFRLMQLREPRRKATCELLRCHIEQKELALQSTGFDGSVKLSGAQKCSDVPAIRSTDRGVELDHLSVGW